MVIQQWAQRKPNRPTAGSRLPRHPPPPPTVDPGPRGPWTRSVRPGLVFSAGPGFASTTCPGSTVVVVVVVEVVVVVVG